MFKMLLENLFQEWFNNFESKRQSLKVLQNI